MAKWDEVQQLQPLINWKHTDLQIKKIDKSFYIVNDESDIFT